MKNSETKEGELYSNSIWPESDTINPEIPDTDIQTILKEVDQELIKAITVEETGVREKIYDLLESINLTTKQDCLLYSQWITDTIGSDEFRNQTAIFYTDNDDGPRNGDSLLILLMLRPFQVKKVELGEQIDLFELFSALVTYCEKIRPDEIEEEKETADYYDKLSDQEATDSADSIVYNEQDWNFGQKNVPSDFEIELGTEDFEVDSPDFKSSEIVHNTSQPKVPATYHDYRLDEMDSVTWHSHSLSLINEVIRCLGQYSNQKMIDLFLKMFDQYGTNISANADKLMNGDATYTA
ncbi:MAG: hypothetical protein KAZ30_03320, partial [Candidatus Magasanikbacteria bacterium]|nr:hypothetical protein [Candidatus Magasanikbacteria bacterium]